MRRKARLGAAGLLLCTALTGCQATSSSSAVPDSAVPPPTAPQPPPSAAASAAVPTPPAQTPAPVAPATRPGRFSAGWRITAYYTAVESFHPGPRKRLRGCLKSGCGKPRYELGSYPAAFIEAVRTEGAGRITSGPQVGRYLTWSRRVGYFWLDDVARDATNRPLRPWVSAAADRSVLKRGLRFTITRCGKDWRGRPIKAEICARFRAARWSVVDVFAPGYGGGHHADVYIGDETGPNFKKSPFYTTLNGAVLGI